MTLGVVCEDFDVEFPKGELQDRITCRPRLDGRSRNASPQPCRAITHGVSSAKNLLLVTACKSGALDYLSPLKAWTIGVWTAQGMASVPHQIVPRGEAPVSSTQRHQATGVPGEIIDGQAIGELWGIPLVRFDIVISTA